jgi:hypothetical protein
MKSIVFVGLALAALAVLVPGEARAQAARTWVASNGDDVNNCLRATPCRSFPGALAKTAAGGEISCVDPATYTAFPGTVVIAKSITISCEGSTAGASAAGANGIVINAAATDVVYLRGLDIEGEGPAANSGIGISVVSAAAVHVDHVLVRGFVNSTKTGIGINVAPSGGTTQLFVADTVVADNGSGAIGGGIIIAPTGGANVNAILNRVQVDNNAVGIRADGGGTTGAIFLTVADSRTSGNAHSGLVATTASGAVIAQANLLTSASNNVGVQANGANATVLLGNSVVNGNATGVLAQGGGQVLSYKNNQINGNVTDGTPVTGVPGGFN